MCHRKQNHTYLIPCIKIDHDQIYISPIYHFSDSYGLYVIFFLKLFTNVYIPSYILDNYPGK